MGVCLVIVQCSVLVSYVSALALLSQHVGCNSPTVILNISLSERLVEEGQRKLAYDNHNNVDNINYDMCMVLSS